MAETPRTWAVVKPLTAGAAEWRRAESAVDVYDHGKQPYRVYAFNDRTPTAPPSGLEDHDLVVLTDPEVVGPMAHYFRTRFNTAIDQA
ncbi:hypothetical protein HYW83_02530 [Candidatus Peregrinibacteria bacterium]|nr:hypothetical protein [Candidatus Peregrinibacteria bacterium]